MRIGQSIHNWIAVVAVLAVALLGVLAIDQSAGNRVETQREALVNICLRQNDARQIANLQIERLNTTVDVLRNAVKTAQGEHGQSTDDRVTYARLQAMLGEPVAAERVPLINCEKEVPKP